MPPPYELETIIGLLDRHHQRATYGAVAALVGRLPRSVMQGLPRAPRYSWVVTAGEGLPSGYTVEQLHPELGERAEVLDSVEVLLEWVEGVEGAVERSRSRRCASGDAPATAADAVSRTTQP